MLRLPDRWIWTAGWWTTAVRTTCWLFAAQLVQRRDSSWALLGFRNIEPEGAAFEIVDPVPVIVWDGVLHADS